MKSNQKQKNIQLKMITKMVGMSEKIKEQNKGVIHIKFSGR